MTQHVLKRADLNHMIYRDSGGNTSHPNGCFTLNF